MSVFVYMCLSLLFSKSLYYLKNNNVYATDEYLIRYDMEVSSNINIGFIYSLLYNNNINIKLKKRLFTFSYSKIYVLIFPQYNMQINFI